jgi:hypothetical protein
MRRRRVVLLLLGCLLLGAVVLSIRPKSHEPIYQGKRLSQWLILFVDATIAGQLEASNAVCAIGTNALPWLMNRIQHEASPSRWVKWVALGRKLPGRMGRSLNAWLANDLDFQMQLTQTGFRLLGPAARSAIPELSQTLRGSDPNASARAAAVMRYLGPEALEPLLSVVQNHNEAIGTRIAAVSALRYMGYLGAEGASAIPVLLSCLKETNRAVCFMAAQSLGNFALEPELVVPALTNQTQSLDPFIRRFSVRALGQFGSNAAVALPLVQKALEDSDKRVRSEATNALGKISPELSRTPTAVQGDRR